MGARIWIFYISPTLTIPLFFIVRIIRDRRTRFLVISVACGLLASALVVFFNIHYIAPIICALVGVVVQGVRHLRLWRFEDKPAGQFLARAVIVISILMIGVQAYVLGVTPKPGTWEAIGPKRAAINSELQALPGAQLVLVRYSPNHPCLQEWVYNLADIDHEKVVWARDMGPVQNEELLHYYGTRHVWLLEPDASPEKLLPYSADPPMSVSLR
jgi:hypothetical protein